MNNIKTHKKQSPSAFLIAVASLLFFAGLAFLFQNTIKKFTSREHLAELETNEMIPEIRELISASNDNLEKIKLYDEMNKNSGYSEGEKKVVLNLIKNTTNMLNKAVELDPENPIIWSYRCNAYAQFASIDGALDIAIKSCEKSIELGSVKYETFLALGGLYIKAEDYINAINIFNTLVQMQPDNLSAHFNLGKSHEKNGNIKEAKNSYLKALELSKDPVTTKKLQDEIDNLN